MGGIPSAGTASAFPGGGGRLKAAAASQRLTVRIGDFSGRTSLMSLPKQASQLSQVEVKKEWGRSYLATKDQGADGDSKSDGDSFSQFMHVGASDFSVAEVHARHAPTVFRSCGPSPDTATVTALASRTWDFMIVGLSTIEFGLLDPVMANYLHLHTCRVSYELRLVPNEGYDVVQFPNQVSGPAGAVDFCAPSQPHPAGINDEENRARTDGPRSSRHSSNKSKGSRASSSRNAYKSQARWFGNNGALSDGATVLVPIPIASTMEDYFDPVKTEALWRRPFECVAAAAAGCRLVVIASVFATLKYTAAGPDTVTAAVTSTSGGDNGTGSVTTTSTASTTIGTGSKDRVADANSKPELVAVAEIDLTNGRYGLFQTYDEKYPMDFTDGFKQHVAEQRNLTIEMRADVGGNASGSASAASSVREERSRRGSTSKRGSSKRSSKHGASSRRSRLQSHVNVKVKGPACQLRAAVSVLDPYFLTRAKFDAHRSAVQDLDQQNRAAQRAQRRFKNEFTTNTVPKQMLNAILEAERVAALAETRRFEARRHERERRLAERALKREQLQAFTAKLAALRRQLNGEADPSIGDSQSNRDAESEVKAEGQRLNRLLWKLRARCEESKWYRYSTPTAKAVALHEVPASTPAPPASDLSPTSLPESEIDSTLSVQDMIAELRRHKATAEDHVLEEMEDVNTETSGTGSQTVRGERVRTPTGGNLPSLLNTLALMHHEASRAMGRDDSTAHVRLDVECQAYDRVLRSSAVQPCQDLVKVSINRVALSRQLQDLLRAEGISNTRNAALLFRAEVSIGDTIIDDVFYFNVHESARESRGGARESRALTATPCQPHVLERCRPPLDAGARHSQLFYQQLVPASEVPGPFSLSLSYHLTSLDRDRRSAANMPGLQMAQGFTAFGAVSCGIVRGSNPLHICNPVDLLQSTQAL